MKRLLETAPIPLKEIPEEVNIACEALRAGREAPEGTFFIKTKRSKLELQRDYYIAVLVTLLIFAFGTGGGILIFKYSSALSGSIFAIMFSTCGAFSWWLWVGTAAEVIADPWYRSMICTRNYLLIKDYGNSWLVELKAWRTVTIVQTNNKGWITYSLRLDGPSEKFHLGDYGHFGVDDLKAFAASLQARIFPPAANH